MSKKGPPIRWPEDAPGIPRAAFEAVFDRKSSERTPRSPDEIMEWQAKRDAMIYSPKGLATGWEEMPEPDTAKRVVTPATDQITVLDLAESMRSRTEKRDVDWWIEDIVASIMSGDLGPIFWPYSDGAGRDGDVLIPTQRLNDDRRFDPKAEGKPTRGKWLWPVDREWIREVWIRERGTPKDEQPSVGDMSDWPLSAYRSNSDGFDWVELYLYPIRVERVSASAWAENRGVFLPSKGGKPTKPQAQRGVVQAPDKPRQRGRVSPWKHVFLEEIDRRVRRRELVINLDNAGQIEGIVHMAVQLLDWHAEEHSSSRQPEERTVRSYIRTYVTISK